MIRYDRDTAKWGELAETNPTVDFGDALHLFIADTATRLAHARNENDYGVLTGIAEPKVVEAVSRIDQAMNMHADTSAPGGVLRADISRIVSSPLTYLPGKLRVRVEQWGTVGADNTVRMLWREVWTVNVNEGTYSTSTNCTLCGAPGTSGKVRCDYCGNLLNVTNNAYRLLDLRAT